MGGYNNNNVRVVPTGGENDSNDNREAKDSTIRPSSGLFVAAESFPFRTIWAYLLAMYYII